jgi:3,4-dihydroxy 2-butanone 4-phosphate synthase/GTP cyclohydrolase II
MKLRRNEHIVELRSSPTRPGAAARGQGRLWRHRVPAGHKGRGIGFTHKLRAYALQDEGCGTVQANLRLRLQVDARDYTIGAYILRDLGVTRMRLMTNNPHKCEGLAHFGLSIVDRVPLITVPTDENARYLRTKQQVLGHTLGLAEAR